MERYGRSHSMETLIQSTRSTMNGSLNCLTGDKKCPL
jgi:hypothetical protein